MRPLITVQPILVPVAEPGFPGQEAPTPDKLTKIYYLVRFLPKTARKLNKLNRERGTRP